MPALPSTSSPSTILVTGASGYIGLWVVKTLLDRGQVVRATVRSEAKAKELKDLFSFAGEKLEFAIVVDMLKEGAFDEAVRGVDAILHLASPVNGKAQSAEEYIRPAVDGTLGIFKSALKNGANVKRIVTTSSAVSVWSVLVEDVKTYNEEHWNEHDIALVKDETKAFDHVVAYSASKTLAEKAAWDFYNARKQEIKWDITFILPAMVYGPLFQHPSSPAEISCTQRGWWDSVVNKDAKTREFLSRGANWVDVRDVAEAHVRALEKEEAGNERFLLAEGRYIWQRWLDIANSTLPLLAPSSTYELPKGFPDINCEYPVTFDTSKEKTILAIPYRTKEETTKDILEAAVNQGWL